MSPSIIRFLCLAVIAMFLGTSCGETGQTNKLIDEINRAKVKARTLVEEADRIRARAREKSESGDREEHARLMDETAELYRQSSNALNEAAKNAKELARLKSPQWYGEYFSSQSRLIGNLAALSTGAHDELLVRKNGPPTDSQTRAWTENLIRIRKENEEFRTQISAIEAREGVKLIKE